MTSHGQEDAAQSGLLRAVERDRWAGGTILRGELPCFVSTVPPPASAAYRGRVGIILGAPGVADTVVTCIKSVTDTYAWAVVAVIGGSPAPADADYLVGTANGGLTNEIVVGTTPQGELGGTWPSPTVDTTHSGSSHAATAAAAEAVAAAALAAHVALGGWLCFTYDFAQDGGAIGAINLSGYDGNGRKSQTIPNHYVVDSAMYDQIVDFAGAAVIDLTLEDTGDISSGFSATPGTPSLTPMVGSSGDITFPLLSGYGVYAFGQGASSGNMFAPDDRYLPGTPFPRATKTAGARSLVFNITGAVLTAGNFNVALHVVYSPAHV